MLLNCIFYAEIQIWMLELYFLHFNVYAQLFDIIELLTWVDGIL